MQRTMILLLGLSAGCLAAPHVGVGALPLEAVNRLGHATHVDLSVLEPGSGTVVLERNLTLNPDERAIATRAQLSHGDYTLRATTEGFHREADIRFNGGAQYYRFVVLGDGIAFQEAP